MNKAWTRPKLIVLVRSESQEAILSACKAEAGIGASDHFAGCYVEGPPAMCGGASQVNGIGNAIVCNSCHAVVSS